MKHLLFGLMLLMGLPCAAQSIYSTTPTSFIARGGVQTCTFIVTGYSDKTVTFTKTAGTFYGTNPSTANEPATIGLTDTTAETDTVTATANANHSLTATCAVTFTTSPTPVTTWPRLLFTQANLSAMQAKFVTSTNPMANSSWTGTMGAFTADNAIWSWSCGGGAGGSTGLPVPSSSVTATSYVVTASGTAGAPGQIVIQATNTWASYGFDVLLGPTFGGGLNNQYVVVTSVTGTTITGNISASLPSSSGTTTGTVGLLTLSGTSLAQTGQEVYANGFAGLALLDPSDGTYNWKCYAHDVAIYYAQIYPLFTGSLNFFPIGANQWSDQTPAFSTNIDWLRGSGAITTSGDLTIMRAFQSYLMLAAYAGSNVPNPANTYNSSGMFLGSVVNGSPVAPGPADLQNRVVQSGNNYTLSRNLLTMTTGLSFNDNTTDAPNIPTGIYNTCGATRYQVCPDGTAGSLIAYWKYFVGALLYNYWAAIDDPTVVQQAYNAAYSNLASAPLCEGSDTISRPCFGTDRDGGSAEGNYYDYSMWRPRWMLNMMHTAGVDDPLVNGPQVSAISSSFWDMKWIQDLERATGPTTEQWNSGLGEFLSYPSYNPLSIGDEYTYYASLNNMQTEASLLYYDSMTGRTDRASALKWIEFNFAFGGPLGTAGGCTGTPGGCGWVNGIGPHGSGVGTNLDMYLALPNANPVGGALPPDPRPSLPTDFYDASLNQAQTLRTSWGSTGTLFATWFDNSEITHLYDYAGRFDVYSCLSGTCDYVTKGRAIFNDYNQYMVNAQSQNEMGLVNSTGTPNSSDPQYAAEIGGGQFYQGNAGWVSSVHSELPTYAAAIGTTGPSYNGLGYYSGFNDVVSASRSILYLRGSNQVVFYDRGAVGHAASSQFVNQVATGTPTVTGNTATWLTQSATQKGAFTTLLPSGATLTNTGLPCINCDAADQSTDWEVAAILNVAPPGAPTSSQFLSTVEWGSSSFTPLSKSVVQSTAGQGFDGVCLNGGAGPLVMFERAYPTSFTGTTFAACGTTVYVSDLTPGTSYAISGAGAPSSATADTAGVLTFAAAGSGNITVGSGGSSGSTSFGGGVTLGGSVVIQ